MIMSTKRVFVCGLRQESNSFNPFEDITKKI